MSKDKGELVTIYLRGGASFSVRVVDWKITRDGESVTKLEWTSDAGVRVPFISLSEIAAVVVTS